MNQSECLAITCNLLKARERSRALGAIGFSHWVKNWRAIFKKRLKKTECFPWVIRMTNRSQQKDRSSNICT